MKLAFWTPARKAQADAALRSQTRSGARLHSAFGVYVDSDWYRREYPDVLAVNMDAETHFLMFGHAEGRRPNEFFDPAWYISNYPNIRDTTDALLNYASSGWREGRNPGPRFDVRRYLAEYPDVAAANVDPLEHYLSAGRAEGRDTFEVTPRSASLERSACNQASDVGPQLHPNRSAMEPRFDPYLLKYAPAAPGDLISDDILNSIAQAYELDLGRQPTFQEVYDQFVRLRRGTRLPEILRSIATSEEAKNLERKHAGKQEREQFASAVAMVYEATLGRLISEAEIEDNFHRYQHGTDFVDLVIAIYNSDEANARRGGLELPGFSDGIFIQFLFELFLSRAANAKEISQYRERLEKGSISRDRLIIDFLRHAAHAFREAKGEPVSNDPSSALLFGRNQTLTLKDWRRRAGELTESSGSGVQNVHPNFSRFLFSSTATPLVSVITSLYRGGDYIRHFLENITSQSIFREHCELLIIDADSPEDEYSTIREYVARFPNIRYQRFDYRLGIYEAWNVGVQNARGSYCTNANLDDARHMDSLELQAATLDALPFVDVVYQDVLYSFEKNLSFGEIAKIGFSTKLPIVSRYNLMEFNCPHNAPMWRRKLHEEIGLFDPKYRSAGDYEFWVRARLAGKVFYKLNEPHVVYFVNPKGLSTRADTAGPAESNDISRRYFRKLISPNVTMDSASFFSRVQAALGNEVPEQPDRYEFVQAALRDLSRKSRAGRISRS